MLTLSEEPDDVTTRLPPLKLDESVSVTMALGAKITALLDFV